MPRSTPSPPTATASRSSTRGPAGRPRRSGLPPRPIRSPSRSRSPPGAAGLRIAETLFRSAPAAGIDSREHVREVDVTRDRTTDGIKRRTLLKGAAAAAAAPVLASCIGQQAGSSPTPAGSGTPGATATGVGTRPKLSGNLNILQWSHFVPDFDTYLDGWAKKWGDTNGVKVTIDRIPQADLPARFAAEVSAKSGHDLVAHFANGLPALFKDSLVDVTDIANRAADKYGGWIPAGEAIGKVGGQW